MPLLSKYHFDKDKSIAFEDLTDFNSYLDEDYDLIEIRGFQFRPSEILYNLGESNYKNLYGNYLEDRRNEYLDDIISGFPTLFSYHFDRIKTGCDTDNERLRGLKDCWEAIVYLLFALVVGEAVQKKVLVSDLTVKHSQLSSDRISDKLNIIESIVKHDRSNKSLFFTEYLSEDLIESIRELNRVRNSFSHSASISDEQALKIYQKALPDLHILLENLDFLFDIQIIRFKEAIFTESKIRCEVFRGHALSRKYDSIHYNFDPATNVYLNPESVLAMLPNGVLIRLSPFLHYKLEDNGNSTRLCFLKSTKGASPRKYVYEIHVRSEETEFIGSEFDKTFSEAKNVFGR